MARTLALQQTERLEALSEQREYCESLLHEEAELQNEHYTDRWNATIGACLVAYQNPQRLWMSFWHATASGPCPKHVALHPI